MPKHGIYGKSKVVYFAWMVKITKIETSREKKKKENSKFGFYLSCHQNKESILKSLFVWRSSQKKEVIVQQREAVHCFRHLMAQIQSLK